MNFTSEDRFRDIRPYHDNEVKPAIQRLLNDRDFIDNLLKFRLSAQSTNLNKITLPIAKLFLHWKLRHINSVHAVQELVATYMKHMIKKTTAGVTFSGLADLQINKPYLFISNHRDIAMDPAFVNWALYQSNFPTVQIAIGDNLLRTSSATDLMKLNKSFIVKRSAKGPREMVQALGKLSDYIYEMNQQKQHIWIAQREGRAKDGDDRTEPAILKMFYMAGKKQQQSFSAYMQNLNIVPVAISYEFDPCAQKKAKEIETLKQNGHYEKSHLEDIESIVQGIVGYKGRVHVHFSKPLSDLEDQTPDQLAQHIDDEIHLGYHLFPTNLLAAGMDNETISAQERQAFVEHMATFPRDLTQTILDAYAKPARNRKRVTIKML